MSHSFLRESKLYIVYGGNKYRIYTTTAISFSQTFAEDSYSVKTLHDQSKMFEGSTITKANPASFSFTVPLTIEKDESIVIDLLSDLVDNEQLKSFDMYVQTGSSVFKLENAVITSGNFAFNPRAQFVVELEGQGTKLTRAGDESYSIPGSAQSESSTRTPLMVYPVISIDSLNMNSLISATLQIQNNIEWTPFETLQNSLSVTNSSNAMFPTTYTLGNRIASGAVQQYQTDNNITQFDDFSTSSNLTIKAVEVGKASSDNGFFSINLNPIHYTARMEVGDVYTQSYDFSSSDNTALATRITQYS
tara:strand:+ start:152 stop:1066 length:915 start_codon:yes stop_codon:yes gene_type:complete